MQLSQRDYLNMTFLDAMQLARKLSGLSEEDVGEAMGWGQNNTRRMYSNEAYWPSVVTIPRLCAVLRNNILIDWLHAQAHGAGVRHDFPALDCGGLLQDMTQLTCDLGDTAHECKRAVASGDLDQGEARRLIKKLLQVCTDTVHTIRGLRPIAGLPDK